MPEPELELLLHPATAMRRAIKIAIIGHLFIICDM
jgi:hypothetical protein